MSSKMNYWGGSLVLQVERAHVLEAGIRRRGRARRPEIRIRDVGEVGRHMVKEEVRHGL